VQTIFNIAKNLRLSIVAEGVETEEQRKFLVENNCDILQGYYLSKPLEASEFEKRFLEAQGQKA
jgi:EAL domain-containing protein (putative c-di-GMP-specific phosphodiesterase class I)